ncbi:MAG: tyrosine-type recombinase/integrase, partial [Chloroflexota bacterium]
KAHDRREWHQGSVRQVRPGVWRAWREPVKLPDGKLRRASRTFAGPSAEQDAASWARGDPEPTIVYLGQWLERWLALRAPTLRRPTIENYQRFIAACGPLLVWPLAEIDEDDWQILVNDLLGRWSRKHVVAWRGVISGALNAAVPKHCPYNGLRSTRLPRAADEPPKAWTQAEVYALLIAAQGLAHEVWLQTALSTGLRLGELRALAWADVDLRTRTITVSRSLDNETDEVGPTKSGKIRTVDLPDELVPILVAHRARQQPGARFVFGQRNGQPLKAQSYRRWLWTHCRRAGVTPLTPHSTRHTFVSLALDRGVPIQDIAQALGHASIATTQNVYSWYIGKGQRRTAVAIGAAIFGAKPAELHAELHASAESTR